MRNNKNGYYYLYYNYKQCRSTKRILHLLVIQQVIIFTFTCYVISSCHSTYAWNNNNNNNKVTNNNNIRIRSKYYASNVVVKAITKDLSWKHTHRQYQYQYHHNRQHQHLQYLCMSCSNENKDEIVFRSTCTGKEIKSKSSVINIIRSFCLGLSILSCIAAPLASYGADQSDATNTNIANIKTGSTTSSTTSRRYWSIQNEGTAEEKIAANTALIDYAVGTINTMYYDHTGGIIFQPREFYSKWRHWQNEQNQKLDININNHPLASRDGTVKSLKWLISDTLLNDPYSKYLTRDELKAELAPGSNEGFLGLGALVEAPNENNNKLFGFGFGGPTTIGSKQRIPVLLSNPITSTTSSVTSSSNTGTGSATSSTAFQKSSSSSSSSWMTVQQVQNLPVVTAVTPYSPAERAGLTVGDRIVAIGTDTFSITDRKAVANKLKTRYNAENYLGYTSITVAKPLYAYYSIATDEDVIPASSSASSIMPNTESSYKEIIRAYRPTRVHLPTIAVGQQAVQIASEIQPRISGGDSIVHYELLQGNSVLFDRVISDDQSLQRKEKVGYIRLTRFSRASTAGFVNAVDELEKYGATSYIIDLRNNYGGIIQEAMLTASSLLRDPHYVLCYTMNSRGGFTPHDVEEYVVDKRYPGYLLSQERTDVVREQVKNENPQFFYDDGWSPMSPYASLHEQRIKRGIKRPTDIPSSSSFVGFSSGNNNNGNMNSMQSIQQITAQKKLVILINEGTASSAEVFASALRDNGRTVALIGQKTFGKGLVQHTFPLPDGGGLRLTVAEYLTPSLKHVSHVGDAQLDPKTGDWVGSGIRPDISCDSKQGIPRNIGADLCVGMALDALNEADYNYNSYNQGNGLTVKRTTNDNGSIVRRAVSMGVFKDGI